MIPDPKLRNPRQDWAQHGPCSPGQSWVLREQEPKERGSAQWTPCLEWQESPFWRRGITDAYCHHLAPCSSPRTLQRASTYPPWASVHSSEVLRFRWCKGCECTLSVFKLYYTGLFLLLLLLLPSKSWPTLQGFPDCEWTVDLGKAERGLNLF